MQARILAALATLLAATTAWNPTAPKVGSVTLEELVRQADCIVIGRVEAVLSVPSETEDREEGSGSGDRSWIEERGRVPVARLAVERTLLGPPTEQVWYLACGTWTCDISAAEVGERVLLFLEDTHWMAAGGTALRSALAETTGGAPVFQISDAGRGSMPLRDVDGRSYATFWTGDVVLPEGIPTIDGPEPQYEFIRSAPLDVLTDRVEAIVARAFPRLSASLQPEDRSARRYRVSVWADGRAFVYRSEGDHYDRDWRRCEDDDVRTLLTAGRTIAEQKELSRLRPDPYAQDVRELGWLERRASWRLQGTLLDPRAPRDPRLGVGDALLDEVRRAWDRLSRESELPLEDR